MIGVDGMTQSEAVGEKRGPEQHGITVESHASPDPGSDIEGEQDAVHGDDAAAEVIGGIVEEICQSRPHGNPSVISSISTSVDQSKECQHSNSRILGQERRQLLDEQKGDYICSTEMGSNRRIPAWTLRRSASDGFR
jgi:hypothetical protein